MKIRRYKGTDREALCRLIHDEMGPNAVVVAPETKGGRLPFGRSRKVELIAILDDGQPGVERSSQKEPRGEQRAPAAQPQPKITENPDLVRLLQQQTRHWQSMHHAMQEIRKEVAGLSVREQEEAGIDEDLARPEHVQGWDSRFCDWAESDAPALLEDNPVAGFRALAQWLPVTGPFTFANEEDGPHVIVMIGPTGSGKTTTLAKLAAICTHRYRLKVGIITTDTYRVAAVDQIREYALLLGVEQRVVFSAAESKRALEDMGGCDVIFVDTPGRSAGDDMGLAMTRRVLDGMGKITVFLTIPASMNPTALPDLCKGFARFNPDYLVLSKIDEVSCPTLLTSLPFECSQKIAFVTNGQRVPDDIFTADGTRLASMLLPAPSEESSGPLPGKISVPSKVPIRAGIVREEVDLDRQ